MPPHAPDFLNPDGTVNWALDANGNQTYYNNPYISLSNVYKNTTKNLISSLTVGYKVVKDIDIRTSFGYNNMPSNDFSPLSSASISPSYREAGLQNQAFYGDRTMQSFNIEPKLNYRKNTLLVKLDILLGGTLRGGYSKSGHLFFLQSGHILRSKVAT